MFFVVLHLGESKYPPPKKKFEQHFKVKKNRDYVSIAIVRITKVLGFISKLEITSRSKNLCHSINFSKF
jgi:hypothetical protein